MLITNHVLSGAVIGAVARSTPEAFGLGVVSHFALDSIPHFGVDDEHLMRIAVPDGLLGLAAIAAVARFTPRNRLLPVLAGVFGACLPDMDKPGNVFFGRSPFPGWFDRFHEDIQDEKFHLVYVEVAAATTSVLTLLALRRHLRPTRRRLTRRR